MCFLVELLRKHPEIQKLLNSCKVLLKYVSTTIKDTYVHCTIRLGKKFKITFSIFRGIKLKISVCKIYLHVEISHKEVF